MGIENISGQSDEKHLDGYNACYLGSLTLYRLMVTSVTKGRAPKLHKKFNIFEIY
jgi:hypothetical protein